MIAERQARAALQIAEQPVQLATDQAETLEFDPSPIAAALMKQPEVKGFVAEEGGDGPCSDGDELRRSLAHEFGKASSDPGFLGMKGKMLK